MKDNKQNADNPIPKGHSMPSHMSQEDLAQMGGHTSPIHGGTPNRTGTSDPMIVSQSDMKNAILGKVDNGPTADLNDQMAKRRAEQEKNQLPRSGKMVHKNRN